MKKKLIIVDINNFIFRAFYAVRMLNAPDGTPVNAIYGVLNMLIKLVTQYSPTHVVIARDCKGDTFRKDIYQEYKANRSETPEELVPQFDLIKKLLKKMDFASIEIDKYEADDVIGSLVTQMANDFDSIYVATSDKDIMQFVNDKIRIIDTMKDRIFGPEEVFEKMGVRPDQIVDYLSMVGDSSDNVPGMRGIGAKGAAKLLKEHDNLETCISVKESFTNKRVKTAFTDFIDNGLLSKDLVKIETGLSMGITPEEMLYSFSPNDELINFLQELDFKTMVNKLTNIKKNKVGVTKKNIDIEEPVRQEMPQVEKKNIDLKIIENENQFSEAISVIDNFKEVAFLPILEEGKIISLCLGIDGEKIFYFPKIDNLVIRELLGKEDKNFITYDFKSYLATQDDFDFAVNFDDLMVMGFVANPSTKKSVEHLISSYINIEVIKKGSKEALSSMPINMVAEYASERVAYFIELHNIINEKLVKDKTFSVYQEMDHPTIMILSKMEKNGVVVNAQYFKDLESEYKEKIEQIVQEIEKKTEITVNLNSPKQVGKLLFETLDLPVIKKNKTGPSTDSSVLQELVSMNLSDIPEKILAYRELSKLVSTYVSVLPCLKNQETGKIHTQLNQTIAETGRLSSEHPNLQNIPTRSLNGKRIRKGFVATNGQILLSADYSQVELRILAHMSEDDIMMDAFLNDQDIHRQTASEIFECALEEVTSDMRSQAKAINFGLMYGQSSFGLSQAIGISRVEARDYILGYFEKFNKVKAFLDKLKEDCEKSGYAKTLCGRKRPLLDIRAKNRNIKAMAERAAINSPIQGTASDIIKKAMINIDKKMIQQNLKSKMILQVHDELIFDVVESELATMKELVRFEMENVIELKVPLKVDIGIGINWFDLK